MRLLLSVVVLAAAISGCATPYQSSGMTGGFHERQITENVYRISFGANGYTTRETAQTYWLYRVTEVALEKGFDGFEILSPIALGAVPSAEPQMTPAAMVYIPMYMDQSHKPFFQADVRLLKAPVRQNPPKVFDARALQQTLAPYVKGEAKCESGNVCPHLKEYLRPPEPAPTAEPPAPPAGQPVRGRDA